MRRELGKAVAPLFTIGHSTHPLDEFLALLAGQGVRVLADVRRFPGSRKFPHFNRENLAAALPREGFQYHWLEALGGRRGSKPDPASPNLGLRNASFRNYADYMLTEEFRRGIDALLQIARQGPTAYMCSEGLFWRCHRRLISDFLLTRQITVQHIMPAGEVRPHTLTEHAKIQDGVVTYPPPDADQARLLFE